MSKEEITIEKDGNAYYMVAMVKDGSIFKERLPSHIFKMPSDARDVYLKQTAEFLNKKVAMYLNNVDLDNAEHAVEAKQGAQTVIAMLCDMALKFINLFRRNK